MLLLSETAKPPIRTEGLAEDVVIEWWMCRCGWLLYGV